MKRLLAFLLACMILLSCVACKSDKGDGDETGDTPSVKAPIVTDRTKNLLGDSAVKSKYVVLMDAESLEIVAEKNATVQFSPASLTKVMTLLVACEKLTAADLDKKLVHSQEIIDYVSSGDYAGTSFSLPRDKKYIGDRFTIRDLLYGIGVSSAADCTYMVVKEIAGSEPAFVELMNQKAKALGLKNTHFNNAVGFDSAENYTTARDMAVLMAEAMKNKMIADLLAMRTENYKIQGYYTENGQEITYNVGLVPSITYRTKYYDYELTSSALEATKTGYTEQSYLACTVVGALTSKRYVLILGEADVPAASQSAKFKDTMIDVETICNAYVS